MSQEIGRSFSTSRRGFLGSTGLAAIGAIIGGVMPLPGDGGGIPSAQAQAGGAAAPAAPKGPQYLKFPGKNDKFVLLGDKPLVAETPESLLDDDTTPIDKFFIRNNGQLPDETKNPDAWKLTIDGEVNNKLEITLGELKSKYKAVTRRIVLECGGNGRSGILAAGARQPVGQWRRRLRRVDRRAAGRRAEGRRPEEKALFTPRIMPPTCICRATPASRPSRAACGSKRRWTPTPCWCGP